ncbi:uncharacterized protein LOC113846194 [Abrus precatorius]|uniref:Uncharacterized protein LOC113846194 n=1 Tax=Abrus precatorius TaxID=3816 RepID=A0A8B8JFI7_ABRPR|nr:uncharacterized protein LOC113846194 [Abrus precatorius]
MSGESAPKPRLVLCPRCRQLLQENPDFDVYKCGGCGTTLQAKKRRSRSINSESSTHKTGAAPTNALDPKADDKQYSNGEKLVSRQENGLRKKATSSSSGECSLDGNDRRGQIESGECNEEQLVTSQVNSLREKETSSSSEECSSNGNILKDRTENGECNGEQPVISQENGLRAKVSSSSLGEFSLNGNGGRDQIDNGECSGEQLVTSQENGLREKATSSSSGECSLNGNGGRDQSENGECSGEQLVTSQGNGLWAKETSSSPGECSLNGNGGRDQIENGECNREQQVILKENDLRENTTSCYSGDGSINGKGGMDQIENGECNGEKLVILKENDLRENTTSCYSGDGSINGKGGMDQIENGECNGEQLVISQENGLRAKATNSSSGECSLNGNRGKDQIENGECNGEQLGQFNLSNGELENQMDIYKLSDMRKHTVSNNGCSVEITHFENEASAEWMADNSVEKENDTNLQPEGEDLCNGNVPLDGAGAQLFSELDKDDVNDEKSRLKSVVHVARNDLEGTQELNNANLLLEGAEQELISGSDREVLHDKSALVDTNPKVDINGSYKEGTEELNSGNLLLEVTEEELNVRVSDGEDPKHSQSALVGAKSEVDNITGNASTAKRSSTEGSISHACTSNLEEGTSGNHVSSKNIHHSFDRLRSVNTFDNTEEINPSSEISGTLGEFSKSPTTRSSHAYDGSVSSNDGVDERFPSQYLDSFENACTVANDVSEGGSRKGKGLVNNVLYGDIETQNQSYFPKGKLHVPEDNRGNQNEVPETIRHGHAHWMRTEKDEFPSRLPHHRSGSHSGYESGSPSHQTHDDFYYSSSYLSPDSYEEPNQEKMKLLRMVYKLQDQLNRTSYANGGETNGKLSMGNHISAYQSHDLHERRFYHGLDYPRCDGRCSHGINWSQKHKFSQVPYLAEPTSSTHHVDQSCFHCCPQEWQCSAELLPPVPYQYEELCRPHPGHSCCLSHHSYPSSPQWLMTSKLLVNGREAKSCDQRYMAPEVKKYFREKPSMTKRHYRPVAGGAPFVTCHKCLKLLQLPADFLLFKRVMHQLKCGACQEVLKFSLQNRSLIVSYAPNALGPTSSDLDDQNKVIVGSNPLSESHANHYHSPQVNHISYSDDYANSVNKSYSSEGDPVSVTPSNPLNGSAYDKPTVSSGTFEPKTDEEKISSRGPSTSKAPVETDEVAVNSNMSSEVEARLEPKSSSLHHLMGYSSPSQVIRGVPMPSSGEGKEQILNGEKDLSHNSQQS